LLENGIMVKSPKVIPLSSAYYIIENQKLLQKNREGRE
jgi:hypothetical protein